MSDPAFWGGGLGILVVLFLFVLAILWFCLPFAVFGIKGHLHYIAQLLKQQNDNIASLRVDLERLEKARADSAVRHSGPTSEHTP